MCSTRGVREVIDYGEEKAQMQQLIDNLRAWKEEMKAEEKLVEEVKLRRNFEGIINHGTPLAQIEKLYNSHFTKKEKDSSILSKRLENVKFSRLKTDQIYEKETSLTTRKRFVSTGEYLVPVRYFYYDHFNKVVKFVVDCRKERNKPRNTYMVKLFSCSVVSGDRDEFIIYAIESNKTDSIDGEIIDIERGLKYLYEANSESLNRVVFGDILLENTLKIKRLS